MTSEERRAWIMGILAIATYAVYLGIILARAGGGPVAEVDYVPVLLWTIGASILASIVITVVATVVTTIVSPGPADATDRRDREIYRRGQYVGQWFVVGGALAALVLAMIGSDPFWIANVIYLAFVLSAIVASTLRVLGYRRGFRTW